MSLDVFLVDPPQCVRIRGQILHGDVDTIWEEGPHVVLVPLSDV